MGSAKKDSKRGPALGLLYPLLPSGDTSSTKTGKDILAAAVRATAPEVSDRILRDQSWKTTYTDRQVGIFILAVALLPSPRLSFVVGMTLLV